MKKEASTLEGVTKKREDGNYSLDTEKWQENIDRRKAVRGIVLLDRIVESSRNEIYHLKKDLRWSKFIRRQLRRLVKAKPKEIYIYGHADLEAAVKEGFPVTWEDIEVALPNIFGRIKKMRWVTSFCTKAIYDSDVEETLKYGGKISQFKPDYPEDNFDQMFTDKVDGFRTEDDLVKVFEVWRDIFLTEIKDAKVVYKKIGSTSLDRKLRPFRDWTKETTQA